MYENDMFVGSREQARLIVQLKLQRFLSRVYIDRAFKNFIASGIIADTCKTANIAPRIGMRQYRATDQKVYFKKEIPKEEIQGMLIQLSASFNDFYSSSEELVTKADLAELRHLETLKGVKYKMKFNTWKNQIPSDEEWLYDFPRKSILSSIKEMDLFDPQAEKERQIKNKLLDEQANQDRNNKKKQDMDEFRALVQQLFLTVKDMVNNGFMDVSLVINEAFGWGNVLPYLSDKRQVADLSKASMTIDENGKIWLTVDGFQLSIYPAGVEINFNTYTVEAQESALSACFVARQKGALLLESFVALWKFYFRHIKYDLHGNITGTWFGLSVIELNKFDGSGADNPDYG